MTTSSCHHPAQWESVLEATPKGFMVRGHYTAKGRLLDDDSYVYAEFDYSFGQSTICSSLDHRLGRVLAFSIFPHYPLVIFCFPRLMSDDDRQISRRTGINLSTTRTARSGVEFCCLS